VVPIVRGVGHMMRLPRLLSYLSILTMTSIGIIY